MTPKRLVGVAGVLLSVAITRAQSPLPSCTSAQIERWTGVRQRSLGVTGRDPVHERLGANESKRWERRNWRPIDTLRHELCGTLDHFNYQEGGREHDWNHFLIPTSDYAHLLNYVKSLADPDEIQSCKATGDCLEAEVTPDSRFFETAFFSRLTNSSTLTGKTVCVYGPWVYEEWHGKRPEIHPIDLMWWKQTSNGPTYLLSVQDASERFWKADNFEGPKQRPAWWIPWAAAPKKSEFLVAFEATPAKPVSWFITDVSAAGVHSVASRAGDVLRDEHGAALVTVTKAADSVATWQTSFVEACRQSNGSTIGFVKLEDTLDGRDSSQRDNRPFGFHLARIDDVTTPAATAPTAPAAPQQPPARPTRPEIGLQPQFTDERIKSDRPADASAWPGILKAIGADDRPREISLGLRQVQVWLVRITPMYGHIIRGKVMPEDDSPESDALNEALARPSSAEVFRLLKSDKPFRIASALVVAEDISNGPSAPAPRVDSVKLDPSANPKGGDLYIVIPQTESGQVLRVAARLQLADAQNRTGEATTTVWNYAIAIGDARSFVLRMLDLLKALPNADDQVLSAASQSLEDVSSSQRPPVVKGRMLRALLDRMPEQGFVTLGNLRSFVALSRVAGSR